jgi:hypothetical protein
VAHVFRIQQFWTTALPSDSPVIQEDSSICETCQRFNSMRGDDDGSAGHEVGFETMLDNVLAGVGIYSADDVVE